MLKKIRHQIILNKVNSSGAASLQDLMILTKSSESSIRADIIDLDNQGLLKRVHGGAYSVTENFSKSDVSISTRSYIEPDKKKKIARAAFALIQQNSFIFIDGGSTTLELAKLITQSLKVKVVTNSLAIALQLAQNNVETYTIGGTVKKLTSTIISSNANEQFAMFNFDAGFFGANGFDQDLQFSTPDIQEAQMKMAALNSCNKRYILIDSSKFDLKFSCNFASSHDTYAISDLENIHFKNFIHAE